MERRAKIVATIGPASSGPEVLGRLLEAGMDVVRLNLSHGTHDDHRQIIQNVRRLGREQERFVPIIADLMGPRFRLGEIADQTRPLEPGDEVRLGASAPDVDLPVEDPGFLTHLRPGERVLIDNGLIELEILAKHEQRVRARVLSGGPVSTRKGINLPDTELPFEISEKDRSDIAFAVTEGVDYIAVSFVGGAGDLKAIRHVVRSAGGELPLIAKLERARAMHELEQIVQESDAVMVARGDLGVEVPLHQVPVLQKKIVTIGRQHGKPVIVATQMLESMMEHPRPTRAESSDVANAVFDSADALMLSGETAAGAHPVTAIQTMARIICEAEAYRPPLGLGEATRLHTDGPDGGGPPQPGRVEERHLNPDLDHFLEIPDAVCAAAVYCADRLDPGQIVAFSQGGFTARMIARYRPRTPIAVVTNDPRVARRLQLVWGARPIRADCDFERHDDVVAHIDRLLLETRRAKPGDTVILLMGMPIRERPLTNLMRIHRVRES